VKKSVKDAVRTVEKDAAGNVLAGPPREYRYPRRKDTWGAMRNGLVVSLFEGMKRCQRCGGTGDVAGVSCPPCEGDGTVAQRRRYLIVRQDAPMFSRETATYGSYMAAPLDGLDEGPMVAIRVGRREAEAAVPYPEYRRSLRA